MIPLRRISSILVVGTSIIPITVYFVVALSRVRYPFALEWIEGNTFVHVLRVMRGEAMYVAPSYEFIQIPARSVP